MNNLAFSDSTWQADRPRPAPVIQSPCTGESHPTATPRLAVALSTLALTLYKAGKATEARAR
jgi:hypothetical protein